MEQSEIKEQIKFGLVKGYRQNLLLLSSFSKFIDQVREYLLTVNVAQQLLEWNEKHIYRIRIEYPVFHFYNNAFVAYEWDVKDIFDMAIVHRQDGHSPTNRLNQKIDLAITKEQRGSNATHNEMTLCGIELKAINTTGQEIIDDARRMSNAMIRTDKVSHNSIQFCFCAFLKRFDKGKDMVTKEFISEKSKEELTKWNSICQKLDADYPVLKFTTEEFDLENTPLEVIADIHKQMDSGYSEVANETGVIVGYILNIERRLKAELPIADVVHAL